MKIPTYEEWQKSNPEKSIYQYYLEYPDTKNDREELQYEKIIVDYQRTVDENNQLSVVHAESLQEWITKNPVKKADDYYTLLFQRTYPQGEEQFQNGGKIKIPPFAKEFMCPTCGHLDLGTYCSQCGGEIKIKTESIETEIVKRLKALGYSSIFDWKSSMEIWKNPSLFSKYAFSNFLNIKATVLCKVHESMNGNNVELLIISNNETITFDEVSQIVTKQYLEIKHNIEEINKLKRKKRSNKPNDYLGSLRIRTILIENQNLDYNRKKSKKTVTTKTGTGGFSLFNQYNTSGVSVAPKFLLSITWDEISVFNDTFKVESAVKQPYDLVRHQVEIVAKQVVDNKSNSTKAQTQNVIIGTAHSIVEEFVEYFKILYQYIKNPYYYSELVASTKFIPPSKVIKLYLIGLVCSVAIPWLLTGGYLNAGNLSLFSELPPFISDIAELLFEFIVLGIVAGFIHLFARIRGRKGSYGSMLLGMVFMKAFLQLFERPYNYLTDIPLLNLLHGNTEVYTKIVYQYLSPLVFLIYAYFLYPLSSVVYKASRGITYAGWAVGYVFIIAISSLLTRDFIFSPTFQSKQRYQSLLDEEKKAIEVYKNEVTPFLEIGDKTGDYSKVIVGLDKCENLFEPLTKKCAEISTETKNRYPGNKHLLEYGDAQCEYFESRLQFFYKFEDYLNGKIEHTVMDEALQTFKLKLKLFDQLNQ